MARLYSGETAKAVKNFPISGEPVPAEVIHWLGRIKGAAATVNGDLGLLDKKRAKAIAAADLVRQAFADVAGNSSLARSWSKCARAWPRGPQRRLLDLYPRLDMPVLLLWADRDRLNPLRPAEEALALLPHGQLRVLESTGFLLAYDDPVGLARELTAFCG